MQSKKIGISNIAVLFLSIYYAWFFLPVLRISFNTSLYKNLFFLCFVIGVSLLFLNYVISTGGKIKLTFNILVPIIIYMLVMSMFVMFNYYDASKHIRVSFTFWGTALIYFLLSYNPSLQRAFGRFLLILFIINCITSFIGVYFNPSAARALTNALKSTEAIEEDIYLSKRNISSIYLFQSLVVIAPIFIFMVKKKIKTFWAITAVILIFIAILKASFTISLLLLMAGIGLSLIYVKGIAGKVLLVLFSFILVLLPWSSIFGYLSDVIDNSYISTRLHDLSVYFSEGNITGTVSARFNVYISSFMTFIRHPFGIGAHYSYNKLENGIGYHSQILDDLARYGVFALAFYIVFLTQYFKLLKKQWVKINMEEAVFPIFIVYVGFLILNIAFRSSAESVVMLYILPVLPDLILNKKAP
ncbi:MAG: hypothetical protein ACOYIJ_03425 [Eubacteriales bacterium]|jgi:hypothetical protein